MSLAGVGSCTAMQALSTRDDNPRPASPPLDTGRDGFAVGGAGGPNASPVIAAPPAQ